MAVSDLINERCKEAFRAETPIIWIQTDSFEIVMDVVERDELVVRIPKPIHTGKRFEGRPYRELPEEIRRRGGPANYLDQTLDAFKPLPQKDLAIPAASWKVPHIITYHVGERGVEEEGLEQYVKECVDPRSPQYELFQSCAVILYGSTVRLSPALLSYTEVVPVPLPDREEIHELVKGAIERSGQRMDDNERHDYLADMSAAFSGFAGTEISRTMDRILTRDHKPGTSPLDDTRGVFETIQKQKEQRILSSEVLRLEYTPPRDKGTDEAFSEVGGLSNLKTWVWNRRNALRKADFVKRTSGAETPKGILVCGIPGCGKSLAARAVADSFGLPLLLMDMGSLMNKYQGESERNMRRAQELAEAMSPCVLWIDELEKGFSGAGSGDGDDASFKRMFATMLNWMQENKKPCFLYATANDIGGLPKEFFRSGRFDALFAAYLPTCEECAEIALAAMKNAERNAQEVKRLFGEGCEDIKFLTSLIDNEMVRESGPRLMIGADISKLVNQALILYSSKDSAYPINKDSWKRYLREAMRGESVYGDGSENVDSVAVSYIRMLKKGFLPANSKVMFQKEDYSSEGRDGHFVRRLSEEELQNRWPHPYDQAVYALLADRIDELAGDVERLERSRLIGR